MAVKMEINDLASPFRRAVDSEHLVLRRPRFGGHFVAVSLAAEGDRDRSAHSEQTENYVERRHHFLLPVILFPVILLTGILLAVIGSKNALFRRRFSAGCLLRHGRRYCRDDHDHAGTVGRHLDQIG